MASTSETGHAKNVANFETLISFTSAYGPTYNPTRTAIKTLALEALLSSAKASLNAINTTQPNYSNAVASREVAFQPFGKLITRVNNALKATDTTLQVDESARTIVRKLQGKRATPKITTPDGTTTNRDGSELTQISTSQMSYDSQIENLDKLIMLLTTVPEYSPNEEELKVSALTTLYNDLIAKNAAVLAATVPLSNARIARNEILYKEKTGLVDTAFDVKTYVKSIFGASSSHYKQISKLAFKAKKL